MKINIGFISNSSSSSFIVKLDGLTYKQVRMIENYKDVIRELPGFTYDDPLWTIIVDEKRNVVEGYTLMDNFDMGRYLREVVLVDPETVEWD